jgi:hypothetical protein
MPYIEPEVILEAKKMDLLTYLQNYDPQELVHFSGNVYCTRTHDSLKISNGKWCWHSRGIGGRSALDYLIKVKDFSFTEAVEQIMGQAAIKPPVFSSAPKESKPKSLLLPQANRCATHAVSYLEERGIDFDLINFCIRTGRLYESHPHHNVVFVGQDKTGKARYASLRGIGSDYKGEASGSDKRYSFSIPAKESIILHLFESAIDLLSFATILKKSNCLWNNEHLLSLAGVYRPQKSIGQTRMPLPLEQYLKDYPQIKTVILHLDNDIAGRMATKALQAVIPKEYEVIDKPPPGSKDYNDYLCDSYQIHRTPTKERSYAR